MDITIRHLSGSRAGREDAFSSDRVTLGRNPSNDVAFDPHLDSVVSGNHAELTSRHDGWVVRDLGSSNGTFILDERVTERNIRPGDIIQLGKNGPRLQINYQAPAAAGIPAAPRADAPVEGRTVMMMMNEGAPATAGAPAAFPVPGPSAPSMPVARPKKKGGLLKALLVVILLFGFLMVAGVVAYVFLVGGDTGTASTQTDTSGTAPTESAAVTTNPGPVIDTMTAPMTATTTSSTAAPSGTQTALDTAMSATTPTPLTSTATSTAADAPKTLSELEQQLARSQQLIDGLQRELQEKNDTLQKTVREKDEAIRQRNAAIRRARDAEARASQAQPQSYSTRRPKPVQVAGLLPPSMLMSLALQAEEGGGEGTRGVTKNKYLKKRIAYVYEEPEIPLPDMPEDMPSAIAGLIIQALGTTGRYIAAEDGSDAGISVVVTNYLSNVRTNVNTEAVTSAVGAISGIFGGPSVDSPVDTKSISMSADMSARIKLYDPNSVELASVITEAKSAGRKTSADIAGLAVNEIANTDTALGDVTRKVAADAVDDLLKELDNVEWQGWITESDSEAKTLSVNCGTRCQIEAGDVFGVYDGVDRVGTAKITRVTPDTASARITEGEGEFVGMMLRYEGRAGDSPLTKKSQQKRTLRTRAAVQAHSGPGTTFNAVKKLNAGTDLSFLYSVGTWAKVSDGSGSFWIPLSSAQITS